MAEKDRNEPSEIPTRILPLINKDSRIVRCRCSLREVRGPMIRCVRCGCLSHVCCVDAQDPFVCDFCHQSAQNILMDSFNSTISPQGTTIELFALRDCLINEFSMLELCETREHCASAAQIGNLFDTLFTYFSTLYQYLDEFEVYCSGMVKDEHKAIIKEEVSQKKAIYMKISKALEGIRSNFSDNWKKERFLPYFRDAVLNSLS